ncbi:MAG: DUF397 domain-containing protein [Pseudonocardiaceae bacterium]|nr:DUF397 domain-containing protein [Pseudonocardiaceae bacterium]
MRLCRTHHERHGVTVQRHAVATADALVGVRDSKDRTGPVLAVGPREWSTFLAGIRGGEFD